MPIPTEPIGSIPRPPALLDGIRDFNSGKISNQLLRALYPQGGIAGHPCPSGEESPR